MRRVPLIAARQCGVFSTGQALADGWTPSALRHATARGEIVRLRAGGYQVGDLGHLDRFTRERWVHAAPAIAAVLVTPGAWASHSTAAVLRGLPLLFLPDRPCVNVVPWHTGEIRRVHVHRTRHPWWTLSVGEVECAHVERTVVDLAREHGAAAGVVALDHALHRRLTSRRAVADVLAECVGWPGVRAAREALRLADGRAESPLESRSRLRMHAHGLPMPATQIRLGDASGRFIGRADFYWDEFGVVGEADGATKYKADDDTSPLLREKLRQEAFEQTGLVVVRWGTPNLAYFERVVQRLHRAFDRGARRGSLSRAWSVLPDFDPVSVAERGSQRR